MVRRPALASLLVSGCSSNCQDQPGEVSAGVACLGGVATLRDIVVDLATGKAVAVVDQPAGKPTRIELVADGLKLTGQGCDSTQAFTK